MQGKVIAVIGQKGGIGKSTVAGTLTTGFMKRGYKTLLVELDPQGNTAFCFRAEIPQDGDANVLDYLIKGKPLENLIQHTEQGDIITSVPTLAGADIALYKKFKDKPEQMTILKTALEPLRNEYDYIFIDNAPSLSRMSVNALVASTDVIVPAKPELYSLQAIGQLRNTIEAIKKGYNPGLKVACILLTMFEGTTNLHKDVMRNLVQFAGALGTTILRHPIRKSIDIADAQNNRVDIFSYRKSNGKRSLSAFDYNNVIDDLQEIWKA